MNKNSKANRKMARKNKSKESALSFSIPKTLPNGQLGTRTHVIATHSQPRTSRIPKVAAKGGGGPSVIEQSKLFYGNLFKMA
jgi:hypothetical protein